MGFGSYDCSALLRALLTCLCAGPGTQLVFDPSSAVEGGVGSHSSFTTLGGAGGGLNAAGSPTWHTSGGRGAGAGAPDAAAFARVRNAVGETLVLRGEQQRDAHFRQIRQDWAFWQPTANNNNPAGAQVTATSTVTIAPPPGRRKSMKGIGGGGAGAGSGAGAATTRLHRHQHVEDGPSTPPAFVFPSGAAAAAAALAPSLTFGRF